MKKILLVLLCSLPLTVSAFDHSQWDDIIKNYTVVENKQTLVDYQKLAKNSKKLNQYLSSLSAVKKSKYEEWGKSKKLAFLINAYNAFTVKLILDHYPVDSIKDIGGWFSNPWEKEFFKLLGESSYLDKIEHEIIRKRFDEPRIHFVVNCASMSCPSLLPEALTGEKLEAQLETASKHFLRNGKKNKYNQESKTLYLSKIFDWYGEDFGENEKEIVEYVEKYKSFGPVKEVEYLDYDWELNSVSKN